MYEIIIYIYHKFEPNVGKYFICGASGVYNGTKYSINCFPRGFWTRNGGHRPGSKRHGHAWGAETWKNIFIIGMLCEDPDEWWWFWCHWHGGWSPISQIRIVGNHLAIPNIESFYYDRGQPNSMIKFKLLAWLIDQFDWLIMIHEHLAQTATNYFFIIRISTWSPSQLLRLGTSCCKNMLKSQQDRQRWQHIILDVKLKQEHASTYTWLYLVGGFSPFEKYWSTWKSSPNLKPPPRSTPYLGTSLIFDHFDWIIIPKNWATQLPNLTSWVSTKKPIKIHIWHLFTYMNGWFLQ